VVDDEVSFEPSAKAIVDVVDSIRTGEPVEAR
jgi:hypothetical protein